MLAGIVFHVDQPPVLPTAKLPTGALDGLSMTTSTRPLTPPAAPEATRASNCVDPVVPKLTLAYSSRSPLTSCAAWLPSTPLGLLSPVAAVTLMVPVLAEKQSAEMFDVAVVVHCLPPPPPLVLIVQLNAAVPDAPVPSVALTVTFEVAAVVGVPEIRPVEELMERPAGSPVAL